MIEFRDHVPTNTCTRTFADYKRYKIPWLKTDFYARCGYCYDHDSWSGGRRGMQIDHFVPKTKFASVYAVHGYENLIYSCFYCNNSKSDDWVTNDPLQPICNSGLTGYIHPRDKEYDIAFKREVSGKILPQTDVAKYMFKELSLGLKRHRLIYLLEKLYGLYDQLSMEIEDVKTADSDKKELNEKIEKISMAFIKYYKEFRVDIDRRSEE